MLKMLDVKNYKNAKSFKISEKKWQKLNKLVLRRVQKWLVLRRVQKMQNNIFGGTMVGVHFSVFVFCLLSSESVYVCRFAKNVRKNVGWVDTFIYRY